MISAPNKRHRKMVSFLCVLTQATEFSRMVQNCTWFINAIMLVNAHMDDGDQQIMLEKRVLK
jgi:hypothetical protein